MPPQRLARAQRYLREEDRIRSLVGGLLLRLFLRVRADGDLTRDKHGKPFLKGAGPFFSLSHGGDLVALAIGPYPCGLDVELLFREARFGLIKERTLTPAEISAWEKQSERESFFWRVWTRKESLLKALGTGLAIAPNTFAVLPLEAPRILFRGEAWSLASVTLEKHALAFCQREEIAGLALRRVTPGDFQRAENF
ncbi:MAG: 4'-phosphopantetheinyl transferase superfamily protein [Deltaproteobacteria bacterium]|nr:4'-phosphopantetheinyl transferase superfamily protein [Deltaproteobacteria bacterium]